MTASHPHLAAQARPLDAGPVALIVLMCLVWGLNQVAIKYSLPDVPPIIQVIIRSGGGLLIVLAWTWWRGVPLFQRDGTLIAGVISGALFAAEFIMIFRGMLYTSASRASLFVYTAPFFVALGARWLLPGERLSASQWLGLALCFAGIAAAIGVPQPNVDPTVLLGDVMIIAGGALWGATTLVMKSTRLRAIAPEKTLIYQLAISVPIMAAASVLFGETITHTPGTVAVAWLAFQVAVVGFTFPIWFTFIQRYAATRVSAFTFLVPLFGVLAGCVLLNEPFTPAFGIAVALVITGLVLVNRRA
jgi:drug/metabolite transporter (DMT)-like permease